MTDPDDFALSALFADAEDTQLDMSHEAFTTSVMAQVIEYQTKRTALWDTLWLGILASLVVVAIVALPHAWPAIQASLQTTVTSQVSAYGLSNQSVILLALLVAGGLSWAVAVKD
jgi:hypothetical protein